MGSSEAENRTMYEPMRPDEKPPPDPKPVRDTDFGSNPPRREAQDVGDDRME